MKDRKFNIWQTIGTFLLSLFIIVFTVFSTITIITNRNFQKEKIVKYLNDNDITFLLKHRNGTESNILKKMKSALSEMGIPEDIIEDVLNSESTKNFLAEYIYETLTAYLYNQEEKTITEEDIILLIEQNIPIIDEYFQKHGISLSAKEQFSLFEYTRENAYKLVELLPNTETILLKVEKKLPIQWIKMGKDFFNVLTNHWTIIVLIAILIIFLIFLISIHYKSKGYFLILKRLLFTYSFLLIIIEVLLGTIIKDYFMSEWEIANVFINYMVNVLAKELWIFVILAIIAHLFCSKKLKIQKEGNLCENI